MVALAHQIASNEQTRTDFLRNVPRVHLIAESPITYIKSLACSKFIAWLDIENPTPELILEEVEKGILAARLPSHGLDPDIYEFSYIQPLIWLPNRVFVFAAVCSVTF